MIRYWLCVLPLVGIFPILKAQLPASLNGANDRAQQLFDRLGDEKKDSFSLNTLDIQPAYNAPTCASLHPPASANCRKRALLERIYTSLRYPSEARRQQIEGQAIIGFVVESDGSLSSFRILQDPGGGTGQEALRVVRSLGRRGPGSFVPGIYQGRAVRTAYQLPVNFELE